MCGAGRETQRRFGAKWNSAAEPAFSLLTIRWSIRSLFGLKRWPFLGAYGPWTRQPYIAEKVLEGGQATVEETKRLAASVLGQDEKR